MKRILLIRWLDAGFGETVEEAADHERWCVGFEVQRSHLGLWLCPDEDAETGSIHFIPKGMVLEERIIPSPVNVRFFEAFDNSEGAD